jgi:hypothetical protein
MDPLSKPFLGLKGDPILGSHHWTPGKLVWSANTVRSHVDTQGRPEVTFSFLPRDMSPTRPELAGTRWQSANVGRILALHQPASVSQVNHVTDSIARLQQSTGKLTRNSVVRFRLVLSCALLDVGPRFARSPVVEALWGNSCAPVSSLVHGPSCSISHKWRAAREPSLCHPPLSSFPHPHNRFSLSQCFVVSFFIACSKNSIRVCLFLLLSCRERASNCAQSACLAKIGQFGSNLGVPSHRMICQISLTRLQVGDPN